MFLQLPLSIPLYGAKKSLLRACYSEQLTVKQQHGIVGWNQGDFSGLKLVKPLPSGSQARLPSQLTLVVPWLLPEMCRRDTDTIPTANPLFSGDHFHGQGQGGERRALLPFILFFFFFCTRTHIQNTITWYVHSRHTPPPPPYSPPCCPPLIPPRPTSMLKACA